MTKPDMHKIAKWLDPALVDALEQRRKLNKEWQRRRKLTTLHTLWLMLAVSLDTQRSSLFEILRLTTGQLDIQWSVSVAAFCKARAHFSPSVSVLLVWRPGISIANIVQGRTLPMARFATTCR
jgi:hypothetical protein